jgi:lipopolysaccharide transport system permease protein
MGHVGFSPVFGAWLLALPGRFPPLVAVPPPIQTVPEIAAEASSSAPQPRAAACSDDVSAGMASSSEGAPPNPHRLVIEAGQADRQYWRDLWRYRELFGFLAWRDILVRYKQTVVGVAWAVIQPLLTMLVMTVVFGTIANLPSGDIPYPILVFAAMLPWQFFANSLSSSGNSLVSNANLISKVYFPRMIVPGSAVVVSLVDFLISFAILAVLMVIYGFSPTWKMLTLPVFVLLAFVPAIGLGLLITALNVRYRDFRFVVPFVVQFGLYVSPVGFSSEVVR